MISGRVTLASLEGKQFHPNVFPIRSAPTRVFKSEGQAGVIEYPLLNALRHRRDIQAIFVEDRTDTPWAELMVPFESIDYNLSLATTENKWVASVPTIAELDLAEVEREVLSKHGIHVVSLAAPRLKRGHHGVPLPRKIVPLVSAAAGDAPPPEGHPLREVFIGTLTHAALNLAAWKDCGITAGGVIKKDPSCASCLNPSNPWIWRALNMHRIVPIPFRPTERDSLFSEKGKPAIIPRVVSESVKEGDSFSPDSMATASPTFVSQMARFKDFRKMVVEITLKSLGEVLSKTGPEEKHPVFAKLREIITDFD